MRKVLGPRDRLSGLSAGSPAKYRHSVLAMNSRLDTLEAVVLRAKKRLAAWNEARRAAARRYLGLVS